MIDPLAARTYPEATLAKVVGHNYCFLWRRPPGTELFYCYAIVGRHTGDPITGQVHPRDFASLVESGAIFYLEG